MSKSRRFLYFLREIGLNPINSLNAVKSITRYISNLYQFTSIYGRKGVKLSPALNDFRAASGSADGHYFWQDLICANWIFKNNPKSHFDVGSRVDGFIAHLAVFMEVFQLDIRNSQSEVPNLTFLLGDAQNPLPQYVDKFKSVSSLHSIEHFGLGRYGDQIDVDGHTKGLLNIADCVSPGGVLYVSFPIGVPCIEFNSQRVIHPNWPLAILKNFVLDEFVLIPWKGIPVRGLTPGDVDIEIQGQAGLYKFVKTK